MTLRWQQKTCRQHSSRSSRGRMQRALTSSSVAYLPARQRHTTTMKLNLERWDAKQKGEFKQGKLLEQLRSEGYSCSTYTFPPGCVFGDHTHGCDKKDAILRGEFLFRMDGEEVILRAGDTLEVPKGHVHYAEVVGNSSCVFVDASKF